VTDCDRCGDDYDVRVCSLGAAPQTSERNRIEANLCYGCRQDVPNENLSFGGESR
jgi:Fe-S-cluster-containing hydrogenase component 2